MIEFVIFVVFVMIIDILLLLFKFLIGGFILFVMIFIFIIVYCWGFKLVFLGGLVWGLL